MTNILKQLASINCSLMVKNKHIAECFVLIFKGDKEGKTIRPFLITPYFSGSENKSITFQFKILKEGKQSFINKIITNEIFSKHYLKDCDLCAIPIASVFEELNQNKSKIDFFTIPEDFCLTENERAKISEYEELLLFAYNSDLSIETPYKRLSLTSVKEKDKFYLEKDGLLSVGSPVFLFDDSSYVEDNSIKIGQRIKLIGVTSKIFGTTIKTVGISLLIDSIKNLYKFDTKFN